MGLFWKKEQKPVVVPEPNQNEIDWFFTEEAKFLFEGTFVLSDEMYEIWFSQF